MVAQVYLPLKRKDDRSYLGTLSSSVVVFVAQYCAPVDLRFTFVEDAAASDWCNIELSAEAMQLLHHEFSLTELLPLEVQNCQLPVICDPEMTMVRSGLCSVVRHVVKLADSAHPDQHFRDLLGFRQGSLRMCSEVSGWTKLCEVELCQSLTNLISQLRELTTDSPEVELPQDLIKLEAHFQKPPKIHNDDKLRRAVLKEVKEELDDKEKRDQIISQCKLNKNGFVYIKDKHYPHGDRRFKLSKRHQVEKLGIDINLKNVPDKKGDNSVNNSTKGDKSVNGLIKEDNSVEVLIKGLESLHYLDVAMEHLYSEGIEMTVADLILFVYMYHVLESLDFSCTQLAGKTPLVMKWLGHMVQVERIRNMDASTCFNVSKLAHGLLGSSSKTVTFKIPKMEDVTDDDMELSRRCRSKHKAYKPDITLALQKIKTNKIIPETGDHVRGCDVRVDWEQLPSAVHPREGNVPEKRTERKCQQLENLVTAVETIARPGDVIVDFCSGGGHLGIAIAYLLPACKVYLIENKEESLMKAKHRIDALQLKNVVLYQCNMDYFHGKFDIGVCLHACGSATDMVLQQCLNNSAAFVICPCCYGSIQKTHLLSYPRSRLFIDADISYKDFLTLGHAADQTEFNIALEEQGRHCSNLVDTDRAELAREDGYSVILCSLQPRTCTPKNNLLIGTPTHREIDVSG